MHTWIEMITDPRYGRRLQRWVRFTPRPIAYIICLLAGAVLYYWNQPIRNRIVLNMQDVLHVPMYRVGRLSHRFFRHLALMAYEISTVPTLLNRRVDRMCQVQGENFIESAMELGRGAIVFSLHMGNYLYYFSYLSQKYPCLIVTSEYKDLYQTLQHLGCQWLRYDSTPPATLSQSIRRHLEANGIVMFLGDDSHPSFPLSEFFGRQTPTSRETVRVALEQQVPVVPFCGHRVKGFVHRLVFGPPMYLHEEYKRSQNAEATRSLNELLEQMIEHTPAQWLYWSTLNERWQERRTTPAARTADGLSTPEDFLYDSYQSGLRGRPVSADKR